MRKVIVGSAALSHWFVDYPRRENSDIDYWTDYPVTPSRKEDCKYVSQRTESGELKYPGCYRFLLAQQGEYASPDSLYTLKVSHSFFNIKWANCMSDILWMQQKGVFRLDREMMDYLYSDWLVVHGPKRVNLNQTAADFYNDKVERVYEHDSIHQAIKYHSEPMYKKILREGHEVLTSRVKWNKLSYEEKISCAREEIQVTALERILIPSDFNVSGLAAWRRASRQVVTSMTKSWFPLFIVENWHILNRPERDYVKIFEENIKEVRINK